MIIHLDSDSGCCSNKCIPAPVHTEGAFKIKLETPNKQTIAAMEEALALIADGNTRKYSVEEALQELKK